MSSADIVSIVGKTIASVEVLEDGEVVSFVFSDGSTARMWHSEDCCEYVRLIEGGNDLPALVGSPIVSASEETNSDDPPQYAESWTWTFYKLATIHANATLRWLGESNGYYSESVSFWLDDSQ